MTPRTVLQYQLGEKIGVGGMGEVYKARDTRLNRFVAMKVLSAGMSADADRRRRFIQEAQAVSALNHPNIITIYDIVSDGETQFMVVEYVDGKTLLELIPSGGLPVSTAISYAVQIAEALCAAHATGIVHRDLKPSNVMVTGGGLVKVLDFGLAKMIEWPAAGPDATTVTQLSSPLTVDGTILGTMNYMSPEQAEGKKLDSRSDIFSFGAVAYEMLTGQIAFRGDNMVATLTAVLRDDVRPLRELVPGVPAELERIVLGCLRKQPEQRIQSMEEVRDALTLLRRQLDSGTFAAQAPVNARPPVTRAQRRSPATLAAVVVLLIAALGGAFWWLGGHRSASPAHPESPAPVASAPTSQATPPITPSITPSDTPPITPPVTHSTDSPAPAPQPPKTAAGASVTLDDGLLVRLNLAEDITAGVASGDPVLFVVAQDVRVEGNVVIRKGARAVGAIVDGPKKKMLVLSAKTTFRLIRVDAVDGQKLPIRVTPAAHGDQSKRPLTTATAGAAYPAYIDGAKSVNVKE